MPAPVRVRFQADNDLRKAIVRGVVRCEPRIDFHSAQAARFDGVPDPEVLAFSADAGRILVSHDFQTIPRYFQEFTRDRQSPGVFLVRQDLPVGRAVETLLLVWEASEPDEWANRICLLPSLVTIAAGRST